MAKMKQGSFFIWNSAGAIFWAISHVLLGYFSGSLIAEIIKRWSHRLSFVIYLAAVILLLYYVFKKIIKNKPLNLITNIKKQPELITKQIIEKKWFKKVDNRYPVIEEFLNNPKALKNLFITLYSIIGLGIIYILIVILDLF
jgi:hypothetical protein